jgi:hypothetical protein
VAGRPTLLATHGRAQTKGAWVVDQTHWDGLPDGRTRATTTGTSDRAGETAEQHDPPGADSLSALLARTTAARISVHRRPLAAYDLAAGLQTPGVN